MIRPSLSLSNSEALGRTYAAARMMAGLDQAGLAILAGDWLALPEAALRNRCEQAARNHDPCISCSTHFLRLDLGRG